MTFAEHRLALDHRELRILQPSDAAELPDDGPVEWAPLVPYWSVLWRSGVALGRELAAGPRLDGRLVMELGCGLGVPSLVASLKGAEVLATDGEEEALEMAERNARENGIELTTALLPWDAADQLLAASDPYDLVLAADVLYERSSVALLLELLPRLAPEVLLADPGRPAADEFLERATTGGGWAVSTSVRDGVRIHHLRREDASP
jgi:predicted nicotinamide N-methyase